MAGRFFASVLAVVIGVPCLVLPVSGLAQDQEPDCADPQTQIDMNQCAAKDYEEADKKLNVQYQTLRKLLAARDTEADEADKGAVDALVAAQRAWVAFRDANCNLAGFQAHGGSLEPMLVASCLADMSRKRTEELAGFSEQF